MKAEQGRTPEQVRADHQEKMAAKAKRRDYLHGLRQKHLHIAPIAHKQRIWPDGKLAKPGRMG